MTTENCAAAWMEEEISQQEEDCTLCWAECNADHQECYDFFECCALCPECQGLKWIRKPTFNIYDVKTFSTL